MSNRAILIIGLAVLLAVSLGLNILFDQRMHRDILLATDQFNTLGFSAAQVGAIKQILLNVNQHVASYVQSAIFVVVFGTFVVLNIILFRRAK